MEQARPTIPTKSPEDISLVDFARAIFERRRLVSWFAAAVTLTTLGVNLLTPNVYTAYATLLPVEKNSSPNLSSMLGSMGGGLGMLVSQAGVGGGGAADKFATVLHTRTLAESVITKHDLLPVLFDSKWDEKAKRWKSPPLPWGDTKPPSLQDGVEKLRRFVTIKNDKKTNVISVSFTAKNPETAAKVANAFVAELDLYLKDNALSTAKRNRIFVESQLKKTQGEMADHEIALRNFQQKNKVVALDVQAEAAVKTYAELKAKQIASEVELSMLEKGTLGGDPRVALKQQEIDAIKEQLSKFESGAETSPIVSFQNAPTLGLTYARLKRELLVQGKVFELLTQQFEMAKIQEAQEDFSFQILDPAIPPEKKSGPKRTFNILLALLSSLTLGSFLALIIEYWRIGRNTNFRELGNY